MNDSDKAVTLQWLLERCKGQSALSSNELEDLLWRHPNVVQMKDTSRGLLPLHVACQHDGTDQVV